MTPRLEQQNQNLPQRHKGRKELQSHLALPRHQECQEITIRGAVADLAVQCLIWIFFASFAPLRQMFF
jgi:hypothetical protein